jgi:hypothetical protein
MVNPSGPRPRPRARPLCSPAARAESVLGQIAETIARLENNSGELATAESLIVRDLQANARVAAAFRQGRDQSARSLRASDFRFDR